MKVKKFGFTSLLLFLIFFGACGGEQIDNNETSLGNEQGTQDETLSSQNSLIFNTPKVVGEAEVSDWNDADFHLPLNDEQQLVAFPVLEMLDYDDNEWNRAGADYLADGTLIETTVEVNLPAGWLEIRVGFGNPPMVFHEFLFANDSTFVYSDVHGVEVKAIMIEEPEEYGYGYDEYEYEFEEYELEESDLIFFTASFVIEDTHYRVNFWDYGGGGQTLMNEIVNGLILAGSEGFAILENPTIPYLRSEEISLDEALLDSDFGAFVPTSFSDEITFQYAHRAVREHVDVNTLHIEWEMSYDEEYLYEIYTRWVDGRTSDIPAFPFDEIFWPDNRISWMISPFREDEVEYWDLPIILAEDLTLDIVRAHEVPSFSYPQAAFAEEGEDDENIYLPVQGYSIQLRVLFDDVLIHIHTGHGTIPPEAIWEMLEDLLQ